MLRRFFYYLYSLEQKVFGRFRVGRVPFVKKIKGVLFPLIWPNTAEVGELKFCLDPVNGFVMDPALYKKPVAELLRKEIRSGDVVVDIGANIGLFTCLMAKLVGPEGKVFAFEPDPQNLELLRRNLKENNLNNVVVVPKAVSEKAQKIQFFASGVHGSSGFNAVSGAKPVAVDAVSIDEFFGESVPKVNLVKMDIIGSEESALRGMKNLLAKNIGIKLLSAFCPAFLTGAGSDPYSYLNSLRQSGFEIHSVNESGGLDTVPRTMFEYIVGKYSKKRGIAQGELYCARNTDFVSGIQTKTVQPAFADARGRILDIFNGEGMEHVGFITSKEGSVRGNHYHKKAIEHTYVLKGKLKLITKDLSLSDGPVETRVISAGDLAVNPPWIAHKLVALEDAEFLHITDVSKEKGGGEEDTFRYELKES